MLDFLELSIDCREVLPALQYFQRLGFAQALTGDAWPHPYAVVTDGRIALGLHDYRFDSPSLTFVRPELRDWVPALEARGIEFEFCKLADTQFNEAGFFDPDRDMICLLEARTWSPGHERPASSALGWSAGLRIPVRDVEASAAFWEDLGFIRGLEPADGQTVVVSCGSLNLLLDDSSGLRAPELVFHSHDIKDTAERLANLDIPATERVVPSGPRLELDAPAGLRLCVELA